MVFTCYWYIDTILLIITAFLRWFHSIFMRPHCSFWTHWTEQTAGLMYYSFIYLIIFQSITGMLRVISCLSAACFTKYATFKLSFATWDQFQFHSSKRTPIFEHAEALLDSQMDSMWNLRVKITKSKLDAASICKFTYINPVNHWFPFIFSRIKKKNSLQWHKMHPSNHTFCHILECITWPHYCTVKLLLFQKTFVKVSLNSLLWCIMLTELFKMTVVQYWNLRCQKLTNWLDLIFPDSVEIRQSRLLITNKLSI